MNAIAKTCCNWQFAHRVVPISILRKHVCKFASHAILPKCSHQETGNLVKINENANLQALLESTRHQLKAMQAIVECAEEIAHLQLGTVTKALYLMAFWNDSDQQWYFKFGHSCAVIERTKRHRRELSLQTVLVATVPCLDSHELEQKFKKVPVVARNITAIRRTDGSMNKEVFPVGDDLTLVTAYHIACHLAQLQRHDMSFKALSGKLT